MRPWLLAFAGILLGAGPAAGQHAVAARDPSIIAGRATYLPPPAESLTASQRRDLLRYSTLAEFRRLARAGFVVVAPQYRGSDGGEGRDELGGADIADVLNALALAAAVEAIDTTKLFMYGESRGGMMTFQALRRRAPVRAAATVGAFTDLGALLAADTAAQAMAGQIWPDFDTRRDEILQTRSAVRWADELRTPLLLLHGGEDGQVSPAQSLVLAQRLEELDRSYELHTIAGEGHVMGGYSRTRDGLVVAWFRKHLGTTRQTQGR